MFAKLLTRAALLAFPKSFRDRIGRPLAQTLMADCRTASGRLAMVRLAIATIDIVRAGLAERVALRRRQRGPGRRLLSGALAQDVRYAARRLRHSPAFAIVAIITLALGIGANTALFQLLDAVRLRPLPVARPGELAEIRISNFASARGNFAWHGGATNPIFEQIRSRQDAFSGIFAWSSGGIGYGEGADRRWLPMILASGSFFPVLGIQPALGRLFTQADDVRGCSVPATVISYEFWQTEFGGDPNVIGRRVTMARSPFEIVGVAPRSFSGLEVGRKFDVAVPLCAEWLPPGSNNRLESGTDWFLIVMGRLKPGVNLEAASTRLDAMSPAVFDSTVPADYPAEHVSNYRSFRLKAYDASRGISLIREQYAGALSFLQATAALVLLIGCANLANLMLARAMSRRRELAARVALGAGRAHLIRVLLAESLLLSVVGAVLGAWMAKGVSVWIVNFLDGGSRSLVLDLPLDWRLLSFISLAAAVTCALCGLVPAWRAAEVDPADVVRAGSRSTTEGRRSLGLRHVLVGAQVALSLLLLSGALLFARSLHNLIRQDLGFRPDGVSIAYVDMSPMRVPAAQRASFRQHVVDTLEATPGVTSAAITSVVPLSGGATSYEVWLDGAADAARTASYFTEVGPHYFRTLDMPIVSGRPFGDGDTPASPRVAIVNDAFVQKFVPDGRPLGKRIWREASPGARAALYEIVGLVGNAKYQALRQEVPPTVYLAATQDPTPGTFAQMLIRTSMPSGEAESVLKDAFRVAGPAIVPTFGDFRTLIDRTLTQDQMLTALAGAFGLLAVILATVGLYGSMSFVVARRTLELGIRIALGASRDGILRLVLGEAFAVVTAGCVAGGVLALALADYLGGLVYGLSPHDPVTMIGAVVLLATVAGIAAVVPALSATRVDPVIAFRND